MKPCNTLTNLEALINSNYVESSFQFFLLDEFIPSYEAFLKLLVTVKPALNNCPYVLPISHPNITHCTVEFDNVKQFVRTRLFKWDPSLKNRVRVYTSSRNISEREFVLSFMLQDDFVGFGEGHEFP
jgi:hypothetical protein